MNSFKRVRAFQIEWEFGSVGFYERGKPKYPEKNLSEQGREPTTNSTHIWRRRQEFEPGPHWWEAVLSPLRHPYFPGSILFYFRLPKIVNRIEKTGTYKSLLKDHCHGIRHFFNEQV